MKQHPAIRSNAASGLSLACALAVSACQRSCTPINVLPPSITVEGRIEGVTGAGQPAPDAVMELVHDSTSTTRVLYDRSAGPQDVERIELQATASTGLPFSEAWHFLHLSRSAQQPGADPVFLEFTSDPGWLRAHIGNLGWLIIRKDDLSLPSDGFGAFPAANLRPGGAAVLARVEDDDPVLPWTLAGCTGLVALNAETSLGLTFRQLADDSGVDCFDMQTLASMFFVPTAVAVTDEAFQADARALSHRLFIVPHVATPRAGGGVVPGIGFIYQATLVSDVDSGAFTGQVTVSVPLTLMWDRLPGGGTIATSIDPLGPTPLDVTLANVGRITVGANDGSIASNSAEDLRAAVAGAVASMALPTGPAGIPATSFLDLLFIVGVLGGENQLPADFSLLALPSDSTVAGAPQNLVLQMGEIAVSETTGVAPALPGGVGARTALIGAGGVVVLQNTNAAGTSVRRFDIPKVAETLPFDLHVLW